MVCVVKENNESVCVCVVRDMSQQGGGAAPVTLHVPCSTTVRDFVHQVARHFSYEPPYIELILSLPTGDQIILKESCEETLTASGVRPDGSVRNQFVLQALAAPVPRAAEEEMRVGASASPTTFDYSSSTSVTTSSQDPYNAGLIKQDTGYVGLVNQAMTCYLNSLLQALYMTPEFRNALYNWQYDQNNGHQAKCIPYQLQKLFVNLQTSTKTAVETTELTRSFGWDSSEAWQQHDIQELCRVMFDALEQVFKDTKQADLIDRLYQGKMTDYVKCLECGKEKSREDTFLDIPLPVRPFGSTVAYGSVVEALRAFVQPETLDGANQYFCENCNKKCDAHKGLKFTKFPYLLTLHLKRFDFDYSTMHRIKLNDKVTFPELLDLNSFVEQGGGSSGGGGGEEASGSEGLPDELTVSRCDDSSTTDSGSALDDEGCQPPQDMTTPHSSDINQDDDEGIDVSGGNSNHVENEKNRRHGLNKGPYLYKLFSIMIHSGSASGGHYYAYIKDFSNGEWFCFNDTSVTRITIDDIAKTFGGGALRGYYSGAYSSSTNAYMLMYRQISDENSDAIKVEDFPEHIKALHKELQDKYDMDRKMKERHSEMSALKVHCHHPKKGLTDTKVYVHNDTSLYDVTTEAYNVLKLSESSVDRADCRLVCYNPVQDTIEVSFDTREKETLAEIMATQKIEDLLLEIKNKDEEFEVYQPGGVTVKVYIVDLEGDEILERPIAIRSSLTSTVEELKNTISSNYSVSVRVVPREEMVLVAERYTNYHQVLEDDSQTLQDAGLSTCNRVYVSSGPVEKPFPSSRLFGLIDRFEHVITLHINLPATDPETLAKLSIPPLNSVQAAPNNKQAGDSVTSQDKVSGAGASVGTGGGSKSSLSLPLVVGGGGAAAGDEDSTTATNTHSDQSTSEDSSLTDSDRTLIGDVQDECLSDGVSPPDEEPNPLPAPEEENWDEEVSAQPPPKQFTYFKAVPYKNRGKKMLKVSVDKRMSMDALKTRLEPFLGVPASCFKLHRHTGGSDYETTRARQCDSLSSLRNDDQLRVHLGRQLSNDEHKVQVYLLALNTAQPVKYMCEWIVAKGGTVGQTKKEIIDYLNKIKLQNLEYNRCRLRKKNWKSVGRVYLDNQIWVDDITLYSNGDIIIQKLEEDEVVTEGVQVCLFVRHWHPSTLTLDPFEEVVLESFSIDELKEKLAQKSGIPLENVEIAKPGGFFPCDMSVLIVQDLEWNPKATTLEGWPLQISEDGGVIFYRDSQEELKALTPEERSELTSKETQRLSGSSSSISSYSPRKERPLKIYLERRPQIVEADVD